MVWVGEGKVCDDVYNYACNDLCNNVCNDAYNGRGR